MDRFAGLAACTVVSKNHLPFARVVCESFLRHHPGVPFFVLLADHNVGEIDAAREPFQLIEVEQLPIPDLPRFTFQYNVLELNCAAKPFLMRHVLDQPGISRVFYIDSDIFVYRELSEALAALEQHSVVLTPHLIGDVDDDGRRAGERDVLEAGMFNAGFMALRNDVNVARLLAWWSKRVYDKCIADNSLCLSRDQRWLDLVPGYFEGVHILRHAGYNVGHWGLTHRRVEVAEGGYRVNGVPLAFFHFSGVDLDRPEILSRHQDRYTLDDLPVLKPLFDDYVARVKAAGFAESQDWPYAFARFDNGAKVTMTIRRFYWTLGDAVRRFGNPFMTAARSSFWRWMQEEARAGSGISRLWYYVHQARPDLQKAFPDILGKDRMEYLSWIISAGRWQLDMPDELAPTGPPLATYPPVGRPRGPARDALPGVNVSGNALSEKGMGEVVRAMVRGLSAAGVPHCVVDYADGGAANTDRTLIGLLRENPYPVNLIQVNAVGIPGFVQTRGAKFFRGKYNIGYWLWELPDFPEVFHGSFSYLDEIWVSSEYGLEAIARVSPIPVVKVPPPMPAEGLKAKDVGRAHFGLEDGQRVFLFIFDAHSIVERKNPWAAIRAFKRAFPTERDARLVLKVAHAEVPLLARLREEAADARVVIIDRLFDREEVNALVATSDCYVSLHRSEGFGLTMAEAMALGKPVIATAHSANLDFMTVNNSLLVRYRLVRLEKDHPPYPKGSTWADPDVDHAAELMRGVYADRDRARRLGERARADVMAYLSPAAAAARITERLALIGRDLEARGSIFREQGPA